MGRLTLIHGPAHPAKTASLFRLCLERVGQGRGDSFIYLVPSRWQTQALRQDLLREAAAGLVMAPYLLGLEDFVRTLYRLCPDRRALLPANGRRLFAEDALREGSRASAYLSRERTEPFTGLSLAVTRFVQELETAGLSPEDLETRRTELPGLAGPKGGDLIAVYRGYRRRLAGPWIDQAGMLRAIAAHLEEGGFRRLFPAVDLLLISGFDTFSPLLQQVLDRLFAILPASRAVLDYLPDRPRLFQLPEPAFEFLQGRAAEVQESFPPDADHPGALLEPHLFTQASGSGPARVEVISCADRLAEVEEIARRIRRLRPMRHTELRRIRVCCRNVDLYAPLVEEVFPRYGLPFHLSRGYSLSRCPVAAAVLAAVDLVLERYARPALLRLLNLPWVEFTFTVDDQVYVLAAEALDAWSRTLPPAGGRGGWLQVLDVRCAYLERELEHLERGDPLSEEIDDPDQWAADLEEELTALQQLRAGLAALFALLSPLERRLDLPAFRGHLLHALQGLGISDHLVPEDLDPDDYGCTRRDARAFHRLCRLLDELSGLSPFLFQQRFPLRALADLLRAALAETYLPPDHPRGVPVAGLQESAGLSCDYLFLCGLVEGEFPRLPEPDIFLEDGQRRALGLEHIDAVLAADRLLFYRAVAAPRQGLCLLYPHSEGNSVLSPSSFVEAVQELQEDAPPPGPEETLFTVTELHAAIGRGLARAPSSEAAVRAADLARQGARLESLSAPLARLLRGLAVIDQRTRPGGLGPYEGRLDDPQSLAVLERRLGPGHAFSTTQLETYARCPFLFFADRILGVVPLRDPEEDESALERGNLIHRALYHFFSERRADGQVERVTPENLEEAVLRLRQILRREAQAMGLQGFFWEQELERLLGSDDGEGREGLLPRFLRQEAKTADPAAPAHFELSFGSYPGMGPRDPLSTTSPYVIPDPEGGDEVRIFGKIDRVDRTPDGRFVVLDYKTGQVPAVADIPAGLHLQLPIYLLACESLLAAHGLQEGVAGAYYQLRDLERCGRRGLFANKDHKGAVYDAGARGLPEGEEFRQLLAQTRGFVLAHVRAMHQGRFHVTRHRPDRVCGPCPYRQSCRLDHRRMRALEREGSLP